MKWGCLQPLSGGFYFGAEEAFGQPAEWIISFPGLDLNDEKSCPNEYPVLSYLTKKQKCPPYWSFKGNMFDMDMNNLFPNFLNSSFTPEIYKNQKDKDTLLNKEVDVVIGVPVCSGLSAANMSEQRSDLASCSCKNNNMKFLAEFTLGRLKPKAYIFENAPALWTTKGTETRRILNNIALKYNYSVTYVKTDSILHDNVQKRERTFVIFWKEFNIPPKVEFKHVTHNSVTNYLQSKISPTATQNDPVKDLVCTTPLQDQWDFKFIYNKYGVDWREKTKNQSLMHHILLNNLDQEFYNFYNNDEKLCHPVKHARHKLNMNLNYFDRSHKNIDDTHVPTIFFKSVQDIIHATKDRFYTIREIMTFMGLPQDYEWPWNVDMFSKKIGQNVPALTGRDVCLVVKNILNNPNPDKPELKKNEKYSNIYLYNNIKPEMSHFEHVI